MDTGSAAPRLPYTLVSDGGQEALFCIRLPRRLVNALDRDGFVLAAQLVQLDLESRAHALAAARRERRLQAD